jgi:(p)ppGpp synthase/HD superfamily hydrolase
MTNIAQYQKLEVSLRYWLQGRGYFAALRALELVKLFEAGEFRKDGVTPNLQHMVEIALFLSRLPNLRDTEGTIITGLLHDLVEDHGVPVEVLAKAFGQHIADSIWNVTKKYPVLSGGQPVDASFIMTDGTSVTLYRGGEKVGSHERNEAELYKAMALDVRASLVKPADRGHNQKTMGGVFNTAKQLSYIEYTENKILPMAKKARRLFPDQEAAYVILETQLKTQCRMIKSMHAN